MGKVRKLVLVPIELEPKIYSVTPTCVPAREFSCDQEFGTNKTSVAKLVRNKKSSVAKLEPEPKKRENKVKKVAAENPCKWKMN